MFARRPVTGATSNSELGHLGVPSVEIPIKARLGFHVVAEHTVHVPLRDVLVVIAAVWEKKRAVQMHPPSLDQLLRNPGAIPGVAGLGQVLLDSPGTDGADDFELLRMAIGA